MRIKIVINPAAGQPQPVLSILNDTLGEAGLEWDVAVTHTSGDGFAAARQAADEGYDLVCAYGGDGTVAEVAAALVGSSTPMGVLPGGTGNALADDLGIPDDLEAAAALIASQAYDLRSVDVGRVGDTLFVLRVTMGFETSMVEDATRELKGKYGWLAYAFAGLKALTDPPNAMYRVEVDGESHEAEGLACIVANSASTGVMGMKLSDEVDVSDGQLDVIIAESTNLATLAGSAADAAGGSEPRSFCRWRGTTIKVESTPAQSVLVDGEDGGETPVVVSILPGAIKIAVPRTDA
ncbi:MAG: diacylglycerol kinase family lipid kinase [Coriobacteriia bacterium]|nr:diacylglycerol kinase family lipid kinase [Coriobacteriia bacterium]